MIIKVSWRCKSYWDDSLIDQDANEKHQFIKNLLGFLDHRETTKQYYPGQVLIINMIYTFHDSINLIDLKLYLMHNLGVAVI